MKQRRAGCKETLSIILEAAKRKKFMRIISAEESLGQADDDAIRLELEENALDRLIEGNDGGIKRSASFSFIRVINALKPDLYVELGAYKGVSSKIADRLLGSSAIMFVFEPRLRNIQHKVDRATYSDVDWANPMYGRLALGSKTSLIFADDHQDVLERMLTAWSRNYDYILFDDDYEYHGDHRAFRNSLLKLPQESPIIQCLSVITEFISPLPVGGGRQQMLVKFKKPEEFGWTLGEPIWSALKDTE